MYDNKTKQKRAPPLTPTWPLSPPSEISFRDKSDAYPKNHTTTIVPHPLVFRRPVGQEPRIVDKHRIRTWLTPIVWSASERSLERVLDPLLASKPPGPPSRPEATATNSCVSICLTTASASTRCRSRSSSTCRSSGSRQRLRVFCVFFFLRSTRESKRVKRGLSTRAATQMGVG